MRPLSSIISTGPTLKTYKIRITNGQTMKPGRDLECFSSFGVVVSASLSMTDDSRILRVPLQAQPT